MKAEMWLLQDEREAAEWGKGATEEQKEEDQHKKCVCKSDKESQ